MHNIIVNTYVCPKCNCHFNTTRKDDLLCCPNLYCRFPLNRAHIQKYETYPVPKVLFNVTAFSMLQVALKNYKPGEEELCYDVADDVLQDLIGKAEQYL